MSRPAEGFVYVATGDRYRREAARSAASLRAAHPGARICLVTDRREGAEFWDDLVMHPQPVFTFRDKLAMRLCPYEKFVFLDADTLILGGLGELFGILDTFDFLGHQLFEGHDYGLGDIPDAFPEFNTGVLGFRRGPETDALFLRWEALYDAYYRLNRDGSYHYSNVSDQKSLKEAVYRSNLRVAVLGPEYNFVPQHVNFACAAVRVLHGRGSLEALARRINLRLGNRCYVPRLDAIVHDEMEPAELRRLWRMSGLQCLRRAGSALAPRSLRDALRRNRLVRRLFLRNDFSDPPSDHAAIWRKPPPPGSR